jgi:hypothetical protein
MASYLGKAACRCGEHQQDAPERQTRPLPKSNQATEGRNEPVPINERGRQPRRPQCCSGFKRADYAA